MPDSHGALCINSFYHETELNITEIQEYEKQMRDRQKERKARTRLLIQEEKTEADSRA